MKQFILIFTIFFTLITSIKSQDTVVVDKIIARVADEIVLQSDIEAQYSQFIRRNQMPPEQARCQILEDLLLFKLYLNQAKLDSIDVTDEDVEAEVNFRLEFFIDQAGSVSELEKHFNKSIFDIKAELVKMLREQFIAQKIQMDITKDVKVTPSEVYNFYDNLHEDSIPIIDTKYEIQQIVIQPKINQEQRQITIDRLNEMKKNIKSGKMDFGSYAVMFSEDKTTNSKKGQLDFMGRGELVSEYANAAFNLKKDEVSDVVETEFGFHIIKLNERKGEKVKTQHILLRSKISRSSKQKIRSRLDSIRNIILSDTATFEEMVKRYSQDEESFQNNGLIYNQYNGTSQFTIDELPENTKPFVENLKEGEISKVIETENRAGNTIFVIYKVKTKIKSHIANPKTDYQIIYNMAIEMKRQELINNWIKEKQESIYIHIDQKYYNCNFTYKGWKK